MYTDPQKLPGVIPGDPRRPIPVLSSSNRSHEAKDSSSKRKQREPPGFFSRLLPRPFTRALETLFGGRRKGELSGRGSDAEFFGPNGLLGEVWDDEMSSSMLGTRMKKVVQNYQVSRGPMTRRLQVTRPVYRRARLSMFLSGDEQIRSRAVGPRRRLWHAEAERSRASLPTEGQSRGRDFDP